MSSATLFMDGVQLMLVGMGLVFLFLVVLIGCIRLMAVLIAPFAKQQPVVAPTKSKQPTTTDALPKADVLAAIELAIKQHRAQSHQ